MADDRDGEVWGEHLAVGLDVDRDQNEERPHGEEVGDTGDVPLQQLGLAGDLTDLGLDPGLDVVRPLGADLLTGHDQPEEPEHPACGQQANKSRHGQADHQPDQHLGIFGHGEPLPSTSYRSVT